MSDRVLITAPYPEGAVLNLAKYASSQGILDQLIMPSRRIGRSLASVARHIPGLQRHNDRLLGHGLPVVPELFEIAPLLELARQSSRLSLFRRVLNSDMDAYKSNFDRAASRSLKHRNWADRTILIGMPGASESLFQNAPSQVLRVLHEVDAHPSARNEILHRLYGSRASAELVPARAVDQISRELDLADVVLSPSTIVSAQLVENGVPASKVLQVPFGVDTERFRPIQALERHSPDLVLVYVGQISFRKGIPFLLSAIRGLSVTLNLIGPVVAPELLVDLPVNVKYLGVLSQTGLSAAFALADGFVFPSVEDNFALAVSEALAAGLPVISTNSVGSSELLDSADGEVVEAGSSDQLRRAILRLAPLSWEARTARAKAFRVRTELNPRFNNWADYSRMVFTGLRSH